MIDVADKRNKFDTGVTSHFTRLFGRMLLAILVLLSLAAAKGEDRATLLSFKNQVSDPLSTLSTWNTSSAVDSCHWHGVNCSSSGRITGLDLQSLSLPRPALLDAIQDLSHLEKLHISQSNFTGSSTNRSLRGCNLEALDLSQNKLTGDDNLLLQILENCGGTIRALNLSSNELTGDDMLALPLFSRERSCNLTLLDVSNNRLVGEFPPRILSTCVDLQKVFLSSNNLSQIVFPGCKNLISINISFNQISGELFAPESRCTSLKVLAIARNAFSGDFFSLFGASQRSHNSSLSSFFPVVERIDAAYNKFTGEVPAHIGVLTRYMDLSSNNLTTIGNQQLCSSNSSLESLLLQNNRLDGEHNVFASLQRCASLKMLDVSFNTLAGELPSSLCENHPQLRHLILWANSFEGQIPSALAKCKNLVNLMLSFNRFEGEVPSQLSDLQDLQWLSLSNNRLSGEIPAALGRLHRMTILQLRDNRLQGEIPSELEQCENLLVIDFAGNLLSGNIPARIGKSSSSVLTLVPRVERNLGELRYVTPALALPTCTGASGVFGVQGIALEDFEALLAARTRCDAHVGFFPPVTLDLSSPIYLDVSNNNLTGEIPLELGRMEDLIVLGLAYNSLTGEIPTGFGTIPTLDTVDMSHNLLQGGIPGGFASLGTLTRLNVSYNNLSGIVPQGPQTGTFILDGNPRLCNHLEVPGCAAPVDATPQSFSRGGDDGFGGIVGMGVALGVVAFVPSAILSFRYLSPLFF
ncbi:receptor-like protein kinase BRI1-like 3 [Selaginella moellendorffii]|uniref:receptor-like protein kinase BRI1-like 3 n=1 Tax=Selaginella moellendorffii TaxID=88036 RepID=UPI000D1CF028|nr:receptor-like protein kinase BRI1-like 3 [Selaginella moellendorffii]|eukprot:XP_024536536.1 receptor-like protein kinase BRI1-like 3 [Selaginella moellendorffii]